MLFSNTKLAKLKLQHSTIAKCAVQQHTHLALALLCMYAMLFPFTSTTFQQQPTTTSTYCCQQVNLHQLL
jgi:hypothetical protein